MWVHGGDVLGVQEQFSNQEFIDFSANINPMGQPQSVKDAIASSAEASMHYPDPFQRKLKAALSQFENIPVEHIICGNGAAEIIFKIAYYFKPKKALVLAPTFAEYEQALAQVGTVVEYFHLQSENDFQVDSSILERMASYDMLILCNPNNPTGSLIDPEILEDIRERCEQHSITLVVDECFMDFLPEDGYSLKHKLAESERLILLKAFTKSFAIPGIRLGYALVADSTLAAAIDAIGPPWSVSVPAQQAGIAATTEIHFLEQTRIYVATARTHLAAELRRLGLQVFDSVTNYLFFRSAETNLREKLLPHGMIIRDCSNYVGVSAGYYRVAVKRTEENQKLITALEKVLWQES